MKKRALGFVLALALGQALWMPASVRGERPAGAGVPRPRLIVLLVLDQFRFDYLARFRPRFVERGFNLLLEGANFVNCHYDYATTLTCPGHATLITGAYPSTHGIVANEWFDPSLNRTVTCVEDASSRTVGAPAGAGASPRTLVGSTIGDELRMGTSFESRVFASALKDRSAVVMGGHLANGAYWLDLETGLFITSDYYAPALPAWAEAFNAKSPTAAYCGQDWRALGETPGAAGKVLQPAGAKQGAPCPDRSFHEWLRETPFMTELELAFAAELAERERLGQGPATDLLAVSVGSIDYIGHAFGPYSPEMADTILRTDRLLAEFFARLDRLVGLENTWIILTADHGAPPTPQFARKHRLSDSGPLMKVIPEHLEQFLSAKVGAGPWVASFDGFTLNLDRATLARHELDAARAAEMAAEALKAMPGIHTVFRRDELQNGKLPRTPVARKAANSFHLRRSGDLLIIPEPFAVPSESETETMHGSPWTYDTHVPLVLRGSAFKPGTSATPCEVIDLVPTLSAPLGLSLPASAEGRPLSDALR